MENMNKSVVLNTQELFPEISIDDDVDVPVINIVLPNDTQNQSAFAGNVPLFIKKLWKMVNDKNAESVIGWNKNGDGFIIYDQLSFVSTMLPKYFKHNHLSSFVRQLNLYDFHKVQNLDKDEFHFMHPFFLKDVPQLLPLIKRKAPVGRQKPNSANSEPSSEIKEVLNTVKEVKSKNDKIANEMTKLREENAALWSEMNSLRVKYSKQTKIINKLIHFLITYMQKHHNTRKTNRTVSSSNSNKYLKTGPKIMELDYRYKNNPHEFWVDFDNKQNTGEQNEPIAYTVVEPAETGLDQEVQAKTCSESGIPDALVSSTIEELLPGTSAFNQVTESLPQIGQTGNQPSLSKNFNSALQCAGSSKENFGYYIDNTQVELSNLKELFKTLTPEDMKKFYMLVNDNYKNQEDELSVENQGNEIQALDKELMALTSITPLDTVDENSAVSSLDFNAFEALPQEDSVACFSDNLDLGINQNEDLLNVDKYFN